MATLDADISYYLYFKFLDTLNKSGVMGQGSKSGIVDPGLLPALYNSKYNINIITTRTIHIIFYSLHNLYIFTSMYIEKLDYNCITILSSDIMLGNNISYIINCRVVDTNTCMLFLGLLVTEVT